MSPPSPPLFLPTQYKEVLPSPCGPIPRYSHMGKRRGRIMHVMEMCGACIGTARQTQVHSITHHGVSQNPFHSPSATAPSLAHADVSSRPSFVRCGALVGERQRMTSPTSQGSTRTRHRKLSFSTCMYHSTAYHDLLYQEKDKRRSRALTNDAVQFCALFSIPCRNIRNCPSLSLCSLACYNNALPAFPPVQSISELKNRIILFSLFPCQE